MTKATQTSKSGDNSTTVQAEIINIQQGLTYVDVKTIALDIFNSNFLQLSKEALNTATQRAEEITNNFILRLQEDKPSSLESVKDPGFQNALYEAQKSYAKTGDKDMADVLVDVLVDRVEHQERNLKQIVLDESISVIPKLTSSQLDTLTLVFLLKYSVNYGINNFETLKKYLETNIEPFTENLSKEHSHYQHLEFAGCGSISIGSKNIEDIFKDNYRGLFYKGFEKEEFEKQVGEATIYSNFLIVCLNDSTKLQLNIVNEDVLNNKITEFKINDNDAQKLKSLFGQHILSNEEIETKLTELGSDFMIKLFDTWKNSAMKNMTLTSVGIAIAQANYRRKTGLTLDLSIWIK